MLTVVIFFLRAFGSSLFGEVIHFIGIFFGVFYCCSESTVCWRFNIGHLMVLFYLLLDVGADNNKRDVIFS